MEYTLLFASIPALVGSIFLMQIANVSPLVWTQQLVLAFLSLLICGFAIRKSRGPIAKKSNLWIVLVSLFLLLIPSFLGSAEGPQRWLDIAGFRLYISAFILPSLLVLLASAEQRSASSWNWIYFAYVAVALSLALQPDASQVTAFSVAAGATFYINKSPSITRIITLLGLIVCTLWAWRQPDPLDPVLHVEGVIDLALGIGHIAVVAAILGLAMPILGLIYCGVSTRQSEFFIVALYYVSIYILAAATQLTPMPLLGFGAGPIFGYFTLIYIITRLRGADTV